MTSNVPSARNFVHGTTTLAMKITDAMPYEPAFQNTTTPLRIVDSLWLPSSVVRITGNRLAGR